LFWRRQAKPAFLPFLAIVFPIHCKEDGGRFVVGFGSSVMIEWSFSVSVHVDWPKREPTRMLTYDNPKFGLSLLSSAGDDVPEANAFSSAAPQSTKANPSPCCLLPFEREFPSLLQCLSSVMEDEGARL
jgi:hypothetical protein